MTGRNMTVRILRSHPLRLVDLARGVRHGALVAFDDNADQVVQTQNTQVQSAVATAMSDASAVIAQGVSKSFGGSEVLTSCSLDLGASEIVALLGPSGCPGWKCGSAACGSGWLPRGTGSAPGRPPPAGRR